MAFITVFTPTFNRVHTLLRTYESLLAQNNKDFIWLIIDDGSSDGTNEMVEEWMSRDNGFEIRYIYKENGGMHTAHNTAYKLIDTELNVCIDSDDKLSKDAIQKIFEKWQAIDQCAFAGIVGLDADFSGNIIGNDFGKLEQTTLTDYYANGGKGDKKLVYRTEIINSVPEYPVFDNEKYVALAYKYRLIDQKYKLAVLNEVLCDVEYQPNGATNTMWKQYYKNPKGFAFWRKLCIETPTSKKRLFIDCCHYVSSCLISNSKRIVSSSPARFYTLLAFPFGLALSILTKFKATR